MTDRAELVLAGPVEIEGFAGNENDALGLGSMQKIVVVDPATNAATAGMPLDQLADGRPG